MPMIMTGNNMIPTKIRKTISQRVVDCEKLMKEYSPRFMNSVRS